MDPTRKANCKLMERLDNSLLALDVSFPLERVVHMAMRPFPVVETVGIPGLLFPGTVYSAYCTVKDWYTARHSTYEAVKSTEISKRTVGCFDCGAKTKPYAKVLGGFASNTMITAVVWSSQPGRVFCGAKPMASIDAPFSQTPDEIKE